VATVQECYWSEENLGDALRISWSGDGTLLALGTTGGVVMVFPTASSCGQPMMIALPGEMIASLSWRPGSQELYVATNHGRLLRRDFGNTRVTRWDTLAALQESLILTWAHRDDLAVATDTKGTHLRFWSATQDSARVADAGHLQASQGSSLDSASDPVSDIVSVAWSQDDKRIALGRSAGEVQVIDVARRRIVWSTRATRVPVFYLAWNPAGDRIAMGSYDGTVVIKDASDGATRGSFRTPFTALTGVSWRSTGAGVFVTGSGLEFSFGEIVYPTLDEARDSLQAYLKAHPGPVPYPTTEAMR
jgi:WD40 repeat protein